MHSPLCFQIFFLLFSWFIYSTMKKLFIALLLAFSLQASAQLTLENIWYSREYAPKFVQGFQGMADGKSYCQLDPNEDKSVSCNRYDIKTGNKISTIFSTANFMDNGKPITIENFGFSKDEKKVIVTNGFEAVYRHSGASNTYVFDLNNNTFQKITDHKIMYADFNADATKVAYVYNNNLFSYDLNSKTETAITADGKKNAIINGAVDWVYEEEFSMSKGFSYSKDGKYLAFYRFDESKVKEFEMVIYGNLYPALETFKYPKAGESNSTVDIYIYNLATGKMVKCNTNSERDQYLPRMQWSSAPGKLAIQRLNRHQNEWELLFADAETGATEVILQEKNQYYVSINDNLTFLKDNQSFIYSSEKTGWEHLYIYNYVKKVDKALTFGNWEIDEFKGLDETKGLLYFTSGMLIGGGSNPSERQLYSIDIKKGKMNRLTTANGWHSINFMQGMQYYLDNFSTLTMAPTFTLYEANGKLVKVLEDNTKLNTKMSSQNFGKVDFGTFSSSEKVNLDYWRLLPPNFDSTKQYPVIFFVYGGPGYQTVKNQWAGANYLWYQYMAAKGYIVISIDNRGSGGRGEAFKKMTYLQLGKYETMDYIEAAKYFGSKAYVNKNRIGIFGWSYGGFMASNCITRGADYFKTAVAVAPVTNWRYYDNIYTERYMRTPQENADGYDSNSPINHVEKIKGNYLLVHGTADDNVHFQNAVEMAKAMNEKNIPYDAAYYPNTNHGIRGGKVRLHLFTKISNYFEKNL